VGHQAILYGRIQEHWEGSGTRWPMVPEYNRAVLEGLPDGDDRWPFLTRHMFAVAPRPFHGAMDRGQYRGYVIHFAASTKDDPQDPGWPERFLNKLEGLVLSRMLWSTARVHFESLFFPEHDVHYDVDPESLGSLYAELSEGRFAARTVAEAKWTRQELRAGARKDCAGGLGRCVVGPHLALAEPQDVSGNGRSRVDHESGIGEPIA
jgi:hypothetical protein